MHAAPPAPPQQRVPDVAPAVPPPEDEDDRPPARKREHDGRDDGVRAHTWRAMPAEDPKWRSDGPVPAAKHQRADPAEEHDEGPILGPPPFQPPASGTPATASTAAPATPAQASCQPVPDSDSDIDPDIST
eukprot:8924702-Pyramimonas_sp.AAC.1